jgi:hypothetical protein
MTFSVIASAKGGDLQQSNLGLLNGIGETGWAFGRCMCKLETLSLYRPELSLTRQGVTHAFAKARSAAVACGLVLPHAGGRNRDNDLGQGATDRCGDHKKSDWSLDDTASGSGDKARIWWFDKDGTFSSWIEDTTGKYQPSEHGRWWVSEQRMSREHITAPSGGAGGPGYRFEQMTVVRADAGELVLTGWDGQTILLKRR